MDTWKVTRWLTSQRFISLQGVPIEALRAVAKMATLYRFSAREFIVKEGDVADAFLVLAEGKARILRRNEHAEDTKGAWDPDKMELVKEIQVGHSFGEIDMFQHGEGQYSVSLNAISACCVLEVPKEVYKGVFKSKTATLQPRIDILKSFSEFSHLSESAFRQLAYCMHKEHYKSYQTLFNESDYPKYCYFLQHGQVRLEKDCTTTKQNILTSVELEDCTRSFEDISAEKDPHLNFAPLEIKLERKFVANLGKGMCHFFKVTPGRHKNLSFQFRVLDGQPNMFISCRIHTPTSEQYTWASSYRDKYGLLQIEPDDPYWEDGEFYIGVEGGTKDSRYELLATQATNINADTEHCKKKSKNNTALVTLSAPEYIGLYEVLTSVPRIVTAVALKPTTCFVLDRVQFLNLVKGQSRKTLENFIVSRWKHRQRIAGTKKGTSVHRIMRSRGPLSNKITTKSLSMSHVRQHLLGYKGDKRSKSRQRVHMVTTTQGRSSRARTPKAVSRSHVNLRIKEGNHSARHGRRGKSTGRKKDKEMLRAQTFVFGDSPLQLPNADSYEDTENSQWRTPRTLAPLPVDLKPNSDQLEILSSRITQKTISMSPQVRPKKGARIQLPPLSPSQDSSETFWDGYEEKGSVRNPKRNGKKELEPSASFDFHRSNLFRKTSLGGDDLHMDKSPVRRSVRSGRRANRKISRTLLGAGRRITSNTSLMSHTSLGSMSHPSIDFSRK